MRQGPPADVLASVVGYRVRADSFLDGTTLASEIPVTGGSYSWDTTTGTIESATVVVAAEADGRSWIPGSDTQHPLGRYGQELALNAICHLGNRRWVTPLGRLRIQDWTEDGGDVEVKTVGVMKRVDEGRLPKPIVPRKNGTLVSEIRRLMPAGIPVVFDDALVDRACPSSFQWDESRIDAVYELIDTWPATIAPDGLGGVMVLPELPDVPTPTMTFRDGEGGTLVSAPRSDTREGTYNHVIARAQSDDPDAPLVQGEAMVTEGRYSIDGPYGDVPRYYSSPTLKTVAQCQSAARSLLAKSLLPSRTLQVVAAVDPRVEPYEPVEVIREGVRYLGYVIAATFPLGPGDMSLTVSVVSESTVMVEEVPHAEVTRLLGPFDRFFIPIGGWVVDEDGFYIPNSMVALDGDGFYEEV